MEASMSPRAPQKCRARGPSLTGAMTAYSGPRAHWALPGCAPAARRGLWTLHACHFQGGFSVSVSLAGGETATSQGLVWLPLLPGKGSSQLSAQSPLFLTSPLLNVATKCLPLCPVPR